MEKELKVNLSPHFRLCEFVRSGVATDNDIDNMPNGEQIISLMFLCQRLLEPLRKEFGTVIISSGYRCTKLNNLVGGVSSSQHLKGEAADIVVTDKESAVAMFNFIKEKLDFDQLIWEPRNSENPRWLHVSYSAKRKNRHNVLS